MALPAFFSFSNKHMRHFWGSLLSQWSWLGGGTFVLQMTSSGRKSACLILVLCAKPSSVSGQGFRHSWVSGTLRAPRARRLPEGGLCLPLTVLCAWENRTFWSELLPAGRRRWGNGATLSILLGFWSKSGCKLLLQSIPSLGRDEEFKIFLEPKSFFKFLIKCSPENAQADELIKRKQFLLYQEAQNMNVSLSLSLSTMCENFFLCIWNKGEIRHADNDVLPKKSAGSLELVSDHGPDVCGRELNWKLSCVGRTWTWVKFLLSCKRKT